MRIAQPILLGGLIALQVVLVSGCAPVPATVTLPPTTPLKSNPAIYLHTSEQRPRILESLQDARIRTVESFEEADYVLNVDVGKRRAHTKCGDMHNVAYTLSEKQLRLMVIKGRGLTKNCVPNVFDDMSKKLATYLRD